VRKAPPPSVEVVEETSAESKKWAPVAIRDAAAIREKFGTTEDLPGRNELARQMEWNTQKAGDARAAYLANADLARPNLN
jgi:hypothetical protein